VGLNPTACPSEQQLAAYVDGRLGAAERAAVQQHLADCDDCREAVAEAVRLRRESGGGTVLPFWRRRSVQTVGGGVLALAAALILVVQLRPELNPFRRQTPYEELVAAVGTNRTVEGRLSGGCGFGPLRSPTRSGSRSDAASYDVLAAAAKLRQLAADSPSREHLHALGVAELILGDAESAVVHLERARGEQPSARLLSDLSAAYLARGSNVDRSAGATALERAEAAIALDPRLPEAYFNRALALEYLGRRDRARAAWDDYVRVDPSSEWSGEARRRARRLSEDEPGATPL
jgi:tetratricopeptide (TPR) repeat protein